jgi:hypothetical protein
MKSDRWKELEPLLDRALDLSGEERVEWLKQLRAQSPDVAEELTAILSQETAADKSGFLLDQPDVTLAGLELGAYRLERPLGQGGMGTVWLARRIDGRFEGVAAVKLLNLSYLTPRGLERFRREGSTLSRLSHPGIARLLDAGISAAGQPYLILEHVDGQRIDGWVQSRKLSIAERLRLFLQVLDAVAHAHASLVIHRDIKPSNILVNADGTVKLLDFGIAKLLDDESLDERPSLTLDGAGAMTPKYAAPEQLRGDPVTTATDVYSLGVLLYVILSGKHPTADERQTPAEIIRALFEVEPGRLGLGDLDHVVLKALRKAPADRYQTVAAFADDLARYLNREPVSARRGSMIYRMNKFVGRHRAGVVGGALAIAGLIAATAFSIAQRNEARRQRDAAVENAERSAALVEIQSVLAMDSPGPEGRVLDEAGRVALAEHVLTQQYRDQPRLVAQLMINLSAHLPNSGDRESGRALLERARTVALGAGLPNLAAQADCERVYSLAYDGQLDSARNVLAAAHAALQSDQEFGKDATSACLASEGFFLLRSGLGDSSIVLLRRFVALSGNESRATVRLNAYNRLAEALRLNEQKREALVYNRLVVNGLASMGYGDTEILVNSSQYLIFALWELGELVAADSELAILVRGQEGRHGAGAVTSALAFYYGQAKLRLGETDSAAVWIERALRDTTENIRNLQNWLPGALTELRLLQGRITEAEQAARGIPGGLRGRRATAAMLRAQLLVAQGERAPAMELLEKELDSLRADGGILLTQFALPFIVAGEWRLAEQDPGGADSLARLGLASAIGADSLTHRRGAYAGRAELLRARSLAALSRKEEALAAVNRALPALRIGYGPSRAFTLQAQTLRDSLTNLQ